MPDIAEMIRQAAIQYGLDPNMMVRIAQRESSLDPNSAHPQSSARGLYQFMVAPGGSWSQYGRGGNVFDPAANIDAGMRYTTDNVSHFRKAMGRDPTPGETYLMHQQGRAGAIALLQNPNAPASQAIAQFYKNPQTARDAITLNGGTPDMTAGQFAAKWTGGMDGKAPQMASATPTASAPAQPPAPMAAARPQTADSPVSDALSQLASMMMPPQRPQGAPKQLIYG